MKFIFKLSNAVTVGFSIIIDIFFFKKVKCKKSRQAAGKAMYGQVLSWYTYYIISDFEEAGRQKSYFLPFF